MSHENLKYLAWIREQPCINCGSRPAEPHHLIGIGLGTIGGKASDIHTIPLCREHHDELHMVMNVEERIVNQLRWLVRTQDKAQEEGEL